MAIERKQWRNKPGSVFWLFLFSKPRAAPPTYRFSQFRHRNFWPCLQFSQLNLRFSQFPDSHQTLIPFHTRSMSKPPSLDPTQLGQQKRIIPQIGLKSNPHPAQCKFCLQCATIPFPARQQKSQGRLSLYNVRLPPKRSLFPCPNG